MKYYGGIDNGLMGAIVILNDNCEIVKKYLAPVIKRDNKTEYDINNLNKIFDEIKFNYNDIVFGLEKSNVRPVQGIRAAFSMGLGYGMYQALLSSKGFSYELINPSVWYKKIFEGHNTQDKKPSIMFCQRKWPNENWKATERSKNMSDGYTDAACIGLFIYLKNRGVN